MDRKPTRTRQEVRADFERCGMTIAHWAKKHSFTPQLVYDILNGSPRRQALRGKSHRIAVMLGIKDGVLNEVDPADLIGLVNTQSDTSNPTSKG